MANHMDRLDALVAIRNHVDENRTLPDDHEALPGVTMKHLRDLVWPATAEDVR